MKPRRTIVVATGLLAVAILAATAALGWRDLLIAWYRRGTVATFREDHRPGRHFTTIRGDAVDWALGFGGRSGLPAIRALQADSTITEDGREYAAQIHEAILRGAHVRLLEWAFAERPEVLPVGLTRALWRHILERDRPFYPPAPGPGP